MASENTLSDEEKKEVNDSISTKPLLDIAFVLDCTGSMSSYIQSCKDNINQISSTIHKETNHEYHIQFGLVLYRDIPPQDKTFITQRIDFTPIPLQIQIKLNKVRATGGGDQPECLTSALFDCYKNLKWRENSIKVIVVITDAPPHGLETQIEDGFPDGDPDTFHVNNIEEELQVEGVQDADNKHVANKYLNVIEIIQCIRDELNASIYSVACEPSLSCNSDYANDFMQYMAEFTDGKFLPLSSASLLPKVIIGSIKQQINLDDLAFRLDEEIKKIKETHGDISDDKVNELIAEKWKKEGVEKKEISVSDIYKKKRSRENVDLLMNEQVIKSLADFKAKCKLLPRMRRYEFTKTDDDGDDEMGVYFTSLCRSGRERRGKRGKGRGGRGGFKPISRCYTSHVDDAISGARGRGGTRGRGRGRARGASNVRPTRPIRRACTYHVTPSRGGTRGRGRGRGSARGGRPTRPPIARRSSPLDSGSESDDALPSVPRRAASKQRVVMRGGMSSSMVDRIRSYRGRGGGRGRGHSRSRGRGRGN